MRERKNAIILNYIALLTNDNPFIENDIFHMLNNTSCDYSAIAESNDVFSMTIRTNDIKETKIRLAKYLLLCDIHFLVSESYILVFTPIDKPFNIYLRNRIK